MAGTIRSGLRLLMATSALVAVGVVALAATTWLRRDLPPVLAERDIPYGEAGGVTLRLDIYRPREPSPTPRPAVLLIHGGGWVQGDKGGEADLADHFARSGIVAVAVGYRLAKDAKSRYPAQVDDVQRAVRWVRAHAEKYGIDPKRIAAVGQSAGGHLAASLGTRETRDNSDPALAGYSSRVSCVVDTSGPSDFMTDESPAIGPVLGWVVPNLFGATRAELAAVYRDASPIYHVDARSAPTLLVHGTTDDIVPVDQSRRLFKALRAAGVEARLVELEGEGHAFESRANAQTWLLEMMGFLRKHLKP